MPITGSIPVTATLAPTSELDTYPVTNPKFGLGGLRTVQNITARDNIYMTLREKGMVVYVIDDPAGVSGQYYTLIGGTANTDWYIFTGAGVGAGDGPRGETGATGPVSIAPIESTRTDIPNVLVKGSSSYSLSGKGITVTYAYSGGGVPITGSAYLTDSTKGTGFPVFFSSSNMNRIDFTSQTLTAGIGESITMRIHVTGSNGSYDTYDQSFLMENVFLWGGSTHESMNSSLLSSLTSQPSQHINESFALTSGYDQYIYYSYPSRKGQTRQSLNNAGYGGMCLQGLFGLTGSQTASYTNDVGYAETFFIYRSGNKNLGRVSVQVVN
jgi:hypothetical protein